MNRLFKFICLLLLVGLCNTFVFAADEALLGQQAEQAGKYREALTFYVNAIQSVSEGSAKDSELREKIIKLSQKIQPPPVVPEETVKYEGRAEAAVRNAKTPEDYLDAAKEYKKALLCAPWVASYYFNLGVVLEKAGKPEEAIRRLQLYLLASPDAQDAREVQKRIAGLEYETEKQAERKTAEQQNKFNIESLSGIWSRWNDGKWVETVEIRINATERKLETKRIKHPLIPPSTSFGAYMWNYDFDGKVFQGSRDEKTENFRLTIANENLLIEEYYYIGGEKMYGGGVTEARGFRFEWKRE